MSLPILANSFFETHRPSLDVFLKWQKNANWSSRFMPIYQWDDVLFVGCAEVPTEQVQTDQKVVYVFCSADVLSQLWEEYQSPTVVMTMKKPIIKEQHSAEVPEGLSPAPSIPSAIPQSASFDDLGIAMDAPALESLDESVEATNVEESLDLGLDLAATSAAPAALSASVEPEISMPQPSAEPVHTPVTRTSIQVPIEKTSVGISAHQVPAPADMDLDFDSGEESLPALNKKQAPEDRESRTSITSITSTNASPEQVYLTVFKEMGRNFKKVMVLVKEGEQIVPWKWDENFDKINPTGKKTAVPLAVPSPFRIVYRSQKSYHGYIVPNDLNDKFFTEWNGSEIPDHLTLSPILVDDHVIGMILGIGDKKADTKACLLQTEHLAEAIAKKVKFQPNIFKAA